MATLLCALGLALALQAPEEAPFREPVALAPGPQPHTLLVGCANGEVLALRDGQCQEAQSIADRIDDFARIGERSWAAVDERNHALVLVRDWPPVALERRSIASPSALLLSSRGLVIASAARRELVRAELRIGAAGFELDLDANVLALPFEPGQLLELDLFGQLLVLERHGGRLALVDLERWELSSTHALPASNFGTPALDEAQTLLLPHQLVDPLGRTSFDDVHWGNLVRNVLRELPLRDLMRGAFHGEGLATRAPALLGEVGRAAGDPTAALVDPAGRVWVAIGGTDELLRLDPDAREPLRVEVGRRPSALVLHQGEMVVANRQGGSLSLVQLESGAQRELLLGAAPSADAIARGRSLFFDARLSHDGWMSCHSCHADARSTGAFVDTLGDDSFGTPKRTPSLLGVGATAPFAWNGSQPSLEAQLEKTLRTTMHAEGASEQQIAELAAFLRSLPAPPERELDERALRGSEHFERVGCVDCHTPPAYTSAAVYAVGVRDEDGLEEFNPPSLRGVGGRERLFHDGRFHSLEQLFAQARHPGTEELSRLELAELAAFLRAL